MSRPLYALTTSRSRISEIMTREKFKIWKRISFLHGHFPAPPPMVQQPLVGQGYYGGFTITLRYTTLGRSPLDEWSARHTDLFLTIHDIYMRQTSKLPAGFEPAIPRSERLHIGALDRSATGTGERHFSWTIDYRHGRVRFTSSDVTQPNTTSQKISTT